MPTVPSSDGVTIAYDAQGSGPAIILVDGAMCYRSFGPMGPLAELLAPHFTVFTYDRRGRGASGDTAPYTVAKEVADLTAVIQAAGGSAFAYGMSSGAALALEAAASGLSITKLALYEPPFIVDHTRPLPGPDYLEHMQALVAAGQRGDAVAHFMTAGVGTPPEVVAQMRSAPMWPMLEAIAPTLVYDTMIMGANMAGNGLPAAQWASVTMPTLVMVGGASPAWMINTSEAVVAALPNARHQTLPDQTHQVDPAILAPALIAFFQDSVK